VNKKRGRLAAVHTQIYKIPIKMGDLGYSVDIPSVPFAQRPIIILGAGIIGCATARQLLLNGFPVVLVAEFLPGNQDIFYASAWAGAAWHAAGGISPEYRYFQAITHRHLLKMAQEDPESGVCIVDTREYLEEPPTENSAIWGKTVVSKVRWADPSAGGYSRADSRNSFVILIPANTLLILHVGGHTIP
jgi:D-amino-acid oxidase